MADDLDLEALNAEPAVLMMPDGSSLEVPVGTVATRLEGGGFAITAAPTPDGYGRLPGAGQTQSNGNGDGDGQQQDGGNGPLLEQALARIGALEDTVTQIVGFLQQVSVAQAALASTRLAELDTIEDLPAEYPFVSDPVWGEWDDEDPEHTARIATAYATVAAAGKLPTSAPPAGKDAASLNAAERRYLANKGHALPDGSFPIRNATDLDKAKSSLGRAGPKGSQGYNRALAHINKRARALGQPPVGAESNARTAQADQVTCPTCDGTGKIRGGSMTCPTCGGSGKVSPEQAAKVKPVARGAGKAA